MRRLFVGALLVIGSVLAELAASAQASLGQKIADVAAFRSLALTNTFTTQDWWDFDLEKLRSFPLLAILWGPEASRTGLKKPSAGVRDGVHPITLKYAFRGTDEAEIKRHMQYVPEAMLLWLDDFPFGWRVPGKTIWKIAPPQGQAIQIQLDDFDGRGGTYIWVASIEFEVEARDLTFPGSALVNTVSVTPSPASVIVNNTVQLTATPRDAAGVAIPGRFIHWAVQDPDFATVGPSGLVRGIAAGTIKIAAFVEGIVGVVDLTVGTGETWVTNGLIHMWHPSAGSGQTVADSVGAVPLQLGSTSGADADDPTWEASPPVLVVDATNDFAGNVDPNNIADLTAFSIEAVVRLNALPVTGWLLGFFDRDAVSSWYAAVSIDAAGAISGWVRDATATARIATSANGIIAAATRAHVVLTFDGATIRIWVNAVDRGNAPCSGIWSETGANNEFNLGRVNPGNHVDQITRYGTVRLYNRALNGAEIAQNYADRKTVYTDLP